MSFLLKKNEIEEKQYDISWWERVIELAINTPGVKVNRENFLQKELKGKVPQSVIDDAIQNGTIKAGISKELASKLAQNIINSKCVLTTTVSFATGLPGGFLGILGGSSVDIVQYFGNFFNLAQRLMYIYGYKDISELDSSQTDIMIAMLGAASGVEAAQIFIAKQLPKLAEKIAAKAISKQVSKNLIKKIANKVLVAIGKKGISMFTGEEIAKLIGRSVPIVGGIVSGTLTLVSFKPMAKRLNKSLKEHYDYTFEENDSSIIDIYI